MYGDAAMNRASTMNCAAAVPASARYQDNIILAERFYLGVLRQLGEVAGRRRTGSACGSGGEREDDGHQGTNAQVPHLVFLPVCEPLALPRREAVYMLAEGDLGAFRRIPLPTRMTTLRDGPTSSKACLPEPQGWSSTG
jgi:hypothetical protein